MGLRSRLFGTTNPQPVILNETVTRTDIDEARRGIDVPMVSGAPILMASSRLASGATFTERQDMFKSLYAAYLQCPWAQICIDAIAASVVAGGIDLGAIDEADSSKEPATLAPIRALMEFANPQANFIELVRSWIVNAQVFGIGYLEVVTLGGTPAALYPLNSMTMRPDLDAQGEIETYSQVLIGSDDIVFQPSEVLVLRMSDPLGSPYGLGGIEKNMPAITRWLYYHAVEMGILKAGVPDDVHVDQAAGTSTKDQRTWREKFRTDNRGPRNIGEPLTTVGGGKVTRISDGAVRLEKVVTAKRDARDEVIAGFHVPPAKAGIIESGNLGGGTGESQDRTWRYDVIEPMGNAAMEPLTYTLVRDGVGVQGWGFRCGEVDVRDSETIENVKDLRLRSGRDTLNQQLTDDGQQPIGPEGDLRVLVVGREMITWKELAVTGTGNVQAASAGDGALPDVPTGDAPPDAPAKKPTSPEDPAAGKVKGETVVPGRGPLEASWTAHLDHLRKRALKELPKS